MKVHRGRQPSRSPPLGNAGNYDSSLSESSACENLFCVKSVEPVVEECVEDAQVCKKKPPPKWRGLFGPFDD